MRVKAVAARGLDTARDIAVLARLARDVPRFLRTPVSAEAAHARVSERLASRDVRFLRMMEDAVYPHRRSPYRALLRHAGCELGDIRALVATEGLEGALRALSARGVYVDFDEMKGRRETVRGSARFWFRDADFANPVMRPQFVRYTGGSGGRPSRVGTSLEFIEEWGTSVLVALAAHGVHNPAGAAWWPMALPHSLLFAKLGRPMIGWFYPVHPLPPAALAAAEYVRVLGRLAGVTLPRPQRCDLTAASDLVRWLVPHLATSAPVAIWGTASGGVRLAIAAMEAGISLRGLAMVIGSEPVTAARRQQIEAAGAVVIAKYGTIELSGLSHACATPAAPDDVHIHRDRYALITRPYQVAGGAATVDALLFTSLTMNAGTVALNVAPGDYARVEERECDCLLGALGMKTHLSEIGSYEKLTGEGVTFAHTNLQHLVDAVLPTQFGGSGLDYQVAEEETAGGVTRLILRVSPAVGAIDEAALQGAFLAYIGRSGPVDAYQARIWHDANTLEVRRERPVSTVAGKTPSFLGLLRRSHTRS